MKSIATKNDNIFYKLTFRVAIGRIFMTVLLMIFLMSCKDETENKIEDAKNNANAVVNVLENTNSMQEKVEELSKMEPLTNEELKEWLPLSVSGMDRSSYEVGTATYGNASSIQGRYNNSGKEFKIEVVDGAGPVASMVLMAGTTYQMDMEKEDEYRHEVKVERKGIEARQTYLKKQNHTHLNFLYKDRFYVEVRAKKMGVDETWETLEDINLDQLQ